MNQASDKIQLMRDQQLTRGMKAVAILGLFAVLASLSRVFVLGWHFIMSVHVALYLIVLAIVFLKSRLSFHFRASAIIILPFILGVAGLTSWGLMAYGLVSLYSFCILATILLGSRAGFIASVISMATLGIIGGCVHAGIITFKYNFVTFLTSPTSWMTAIFGIALSAGIIVLTLEAAHTQMEELTNSLKIKNDELLESNLLLRCEIAERIRAEEERQKSKTDCRLQKKWKRLALLAGGVAHDLNNILGGIVGYPICYLMNSQNRARCEIRLKPSKNQESRLLP